MDVERVPDRSEAPASPKWLGPWPSLAVLLLVSMGVRLALAPVVMNWDDRRHFIGASHKTLRFGLASAYQTIPEYEGRRKVRLPYPPIPVYVYAAVGWSYSRFFDPGFREIGEFTELPFESRVLSYMIKLPVFLFELLLAVVIFLFVRKRAGDRRALICSALYVMNPAVIYDSALWAQPDSIHSCFLAIATVFLLEKRPALCLSFLTLAMLSKPQAVMAAPLILIYLFTNGAVRESLKAVLASGATAAIIFCPFLMQNPSTITDMLQTMAGRDTYVSGNAHNFWWLLMSIVGLDPKMDDGSKAIAGLSYSFVSVAMVLALYVLALTLLLKKKVPLTPELPAYVCLLTFIFAVRMHENHAIQIVPLLALTGLTLPRQRVVFAGLTLTLFANMLMHSREITGADTSALMFAARLMNSTIFVALLGYWSWKLFHRSRRAATRPDAGDPA